MKPPHPGRFWITGVVWSSETPSPDSVREAMLCAVYRTFYVLKHGGASTLGDILRQEGWVMLHSGCNLPTLSGGETEWTRAVLDNLKDCADTATLIECLFGDEAAATLGYSGHRLASWAKLRLALEDSRRNRNIEVHCGQDHS